VQGIKYVYYYYLFELQMGFYPVAEDMLMELQTMSVTDYIKHYLRSHANRTHAGRFPKAILRY
jgi:hypothetical protein